MSDSNDKRVGSSKAVVTAAVAFAVACAGIAAFGGRAPSRALAAQPTCLGHLAIEPTIPGQFNVPGGVDGQEVADCLAWQSFVYLNWQAKPGARVPDPSVPASDFGKPMSSPGPVTVWQSYPTRAEIFPQTQSNSARPGHLLLRALNEFSPHDLFDVQSINQVNGGWLTGQNRKLVFYDVRANPDLRDYIYDPNNQLQRAVNQARCVRGKVGLQMPRGNGGASPGSGPADVDCLGNAKRYGAEIGAIQIKAAWLDLTGASADVLKQFLIAKADLQYPNQPVRRDQTVGLVGLHVVRKLPGKPGADQLIWATFEHVRNVPDLASPQPGPWTFNNGQPSPVPNLKPRKCPNPPATPSPNCTPFDVPIQAARAVAIEPKQRETTARFVELIGSNASVFKNYELIHVQWPTRPRPVPPGSVTPLSVEGMVPPAQAPVANAVIETYMQINQKPGFRSCVDCHSSAAISAAAEPSNTFRMHGLKRSATPGTNVIPVYPHGARPKAGRNMTLQAAATGDPASDYSFLFLNAN